MNHKCKMCGGALSITGKERIVTCEYCGTSQTIPCPDSERIAGLYEKADAYRRKLEFDKALVLYEEIITENPSDAECYWLALLCEFGIEYVEESDGKRLPTINRMQAESVFDNVNYKAVLKYATEEQAAVYKAEAEEISGIQKRILNISSKEKPFDIFICYKESDEKGRRTLDSVLAMDLYELLNQEGYKVFFARVTLDDKFGVAYEPYIYAALQSSKVMIAVGTKPEYYNAVWVRNEWNRYLGMIKKGAGKVLIPAYRDMNPYELPEEFRHLQAINMGELGYQQDLLRGIRRIVEPSVKKEKGAVAPGGEGIVKEPVAKEGEKSLSDASQLIKLLEERKWDEAEQCAEEILKEKPKNLRAKTAKLMAGMRISEKGDFRVWAMRPPEKPILEILEKGSKEEVQNLKRALEAELPERPEELYQKYKEKFDTVKNSETMIECAGVFKSLREYKDSRKLWSIAKDSIIDYQRLERDEYRRIIALHSSDKRSEVEEALALMKKSQSPLISESNIAACEKKLQVKEKEKKYALIKTVALLILILILIVWLFS